MRALYVLPLVLFAPLVVHSFVGCKETTDATATDAAASSGSGSLAASVSGSTSGSAMADVDAGPHTYGDLTDAEITDALKRKRVIAVVRVKGMQRDDVGTKNEATRYELDLIKPLNGSPPTETIQRIDDATGPWMAPGRAYAVVIDRRYMRMLVRAVEIPEDKIKDQSLALEARVVKIAPGVAASASADEADDDDAPPTASASGKASATPSTSAKSSASVKPTVSAKQTTGPSMTAGAPKPPTGGTTTPK